MSVDDFGNCFANKIGTTVDAIIDDLKKLGADGIQAVVNWWNNLDANSRGLVTVLAPFATTTLGVILTKALNATTAGALIAFLGGASWALLMKSFADCVGQL
ncbi:hypothetical protein [Mycobacterium sp.]|uniref:hypothetical protein n=1 Tax=Mycobacterium sp. TaxID=1785 RepID=UPI003D0F93B0